MQYDDFSNDDRPTWGVPSPRDGGGDLGLVRETVRKEQVIKSVSTFQTSCNFGFYLLALGRS